MLKGEKVILRALEPGDVPNCHRWINDWEVTRFLLNIYPWSMVEEQKWYDELQQQRAHMWAILAPSQERGLTGDGKHIGNVILDRIRAEDAIAALGILIGEKEYWGKGYGTDAIKTLLKFAFEQMNLNRVWLSVLEFNPRAQHCYQKCGFQVEGRLRQAVFRDGRYWDDIVMGVLRDEFAGRKD